MYQSGNLVVVNKPAVKSKRKTVSVINVKTGAIYSKYRKDLTLKKVKSIDINTVAIANINSRLKKISRYQLQDVMKLHASDVLKIKTLKTSRNIDVVSIVTILNKK